MSILKRNTAPISEKAWTEIDNRAIDVIKSLISTRRVLKVNGPKGLDYTALPIGRLDHVDDLKAINVVKTGIYKTQNLIESRIEFELDKAELDNVERGSKDVELFNLEKAMEKLLVFEEETIYNGMEKFGIEGIKKSAGHNLSLGENGNEILKAIGDGKYALHNSYAKGPFDLIVPSKVYDKINTIYDGVFLMKLIEDLIGGTIVRTKVLDKALMIPHRDEDLELTIGQDFSIGYVGENEKAVRLFAFETFTFRILDNMKIVLFS
ncbi:family 1 encapsulin nanocompartment shell protein [Miniphocaeibacter halophilus]|uniref:Bacteriocin family protein n=1 Tax=Miniphocaeibacter halophilus TaxID=2931922 RepID=A0AC61MQC8_9FIRM|nr:family 1 encapsulin nanocompartment shell protein [Miniphocaeibacter halophilus]QQK07872.1 bacteriocin family protein [Miniphocaeibacter halophilus]